MFIIKITTDETINVEAITSYSGLDKRTLFKSKEIKAKTAPNLNISLAEYS